MKSFENSLFVRACKKQNFENRPPVWMMRQAGRYQNSYQQLKAKYSMIEICTNHDLMVHATLLPVNEFQPDAAIIFSDLLIPFLPMGIQFDYEKGVGPKIYNPLRKDQDIKQLKNFNVADGLKFTGQALTVLNNQLDIPTIGFVGAPFTLASYLIEGQGTKNFVETKKFLYQFPDAWHELILFLAQKMSEYALFQYESGAAAVQIFDSWIGVLDYYEFENFVFPHLEFMTQHIKSHTDRPLIYFGTSTAHLLPLINRLPLDVIGLDYKTNLPSIRDQIKDKAIQGNLDPTVLFADQSYIYDRTIRLLNAMKHDPGYIFNLGHGILPETPYENVKFLFNLIKTYQS